MPNWMKKNFNFDNWQANVKQVVDANIKASDKAILLMQKSDTYCLYNYRLFKSEESRGRKISRLKKTISFLLLIVLLQIETSPIKF